MAKDYTIKIAKESGFPDAEFYVTVEGKSNTSHRVHVSEDYYRELTDESVSVKELVRDSFTFLLEREANTSILDEFSLSTIERYFPEFKQEMQGQYGLLAGDEQESDNDEKTEQQNEKNKPSLKDKVLKSLPTITFKDDS